MTAAPKFAASPLPALSVEAEVHDQHQLELRFNYAIGNRQEEQRYQLQCHFFVPRNVGVSRANYSRGAFYADTTALMRLDTPPLPLEDLARAGCKASPLHPLSMALEHFQGSRRPPPSLPLATLVKLYAYLYAGAVKTEVDGLRARLEANAPSTEASLAASLARFREGLNAFRRLRGAFWPFEVLAHESLAATLRASDEYMSLFLEEQLASVALLLTENPAYLDGTGRAARLRLAIAALLHEEARYREKYGYLSVGENGTPDGEYFTYRLSLLKKSVHQALYLDARTSRSDRFLRNAIGATGAALAAIWALLATPLPGTFAQLGGATQVLFSAGVVLAYVLKDRIKALTGEYLTPWLRKYDHVFRVGSTSLEAMGLAGLQLHLSEAMSFVSSGDVPEAIRQLRSSLRTVHSAELATEEVIQYRKQLIVDTKMMDPAKLGEGFRVRDIFRLNVRHFLVRLDDPIDPLVYFDPRRGAFLAAQLPKVYHVNVVLRLERTDRTGHGEARLERFRVVINKAGLVRVDGVASTGTIPVTPSTHAGHPERRGSPSHAGASEGS